jgi:hypothetical protein
VYRVYMAVLNLRGMDEKLVARVKSQAALEGKKIREWVEWVLAAQFPGGNYGDEQGRAEGVFGAKNTEATEAGKREPRKRKLRDTGAAERTGGAAGEASVLSGAGGQVEGRVGKVPKCPRCSKTLTLWSEGWWKCDVHGKFQTGELG